MRSKGASPLTMWRAQYMLFQQSKGSWFWKVLALARCLEQPAFVSTYLWKQSSFSSGSHNSRIHNCHNWLFFVTRWLCLLSIGEFKQTSQSKHVDICRHTQRRYPALFSTFIDPSLISKYGHSFSWKTTLLQLKYSNRPWLSLVEYEYWHERKLYTTFFT
jgi:hypothetical protein